MTFLSPSWHLNMILYLVTMHWAPGCLWHGSRQNGLWTPTLPLTPPTLVTCVSEREQSHFMLNSPPKNSHCQNSACGMYINIPSYARSCSFKTSARSSQPASLTFSGPVNTTCISLLAQGHGLSLLFFIHLLYASSHHLSIIIVFIYHLLYIR